MLSIAKNYFTWHFIKWRFLLFLLLLRKVPSTESAGEGWGRNLRNIRRIGTQQDTVNPVNQWGYNSSEVSPAPEFRESPEFGSFQKIAQNFFASFKIGQQLPQKLPNATKTLKKLPKVAQNFYIFVKSTQKKLPKSSCRRRPFTTEAPP